MPGHAEWNKTIAELGVSCPGSGHASDKVRELFFDTIKKMHDKGWLDSEKNRVFARHIAVWMCHCTDSLPPVPRSEMVDMVQTYIKNYNTADICKGGCDCAAAARAAIDILNSLERAKGSEIPRISSTPVR